MDLSRAGTGIFPPSPAASRVDCPKCFPGKSFRQGARKWNSRKITARIVSRLPAAVGTAAEKSSQVHGRQRIGNSVTVHGPPKSPFAPRKHAAFAERKATIDWELSPRVRVRRGRIERCRKFHTPPPFVPFLTQGDFTCPVAPNPVSTPSLGPLSSPPSSVMAVCMTSHPPLDTALAADDANGKSKPAEARSSAWTTIRSGQAKEEPASAKQGTANLPLKRVVLFSSGVGYFEHDGKVTDNAKVDLKFKVKDINDLSKSMVVQDFDGGHVSTVGYGSNDPLDKRLSSFAIDLTAIRRWPNSWSRSAARRSKPTPPTGLWARS